MKKTLAIIFCLIIKNTNVYAKENLLIDSLSAHYNLDSLKKNSKYFRDKSILPLPIVFRLPETGFAGGALVTGTFKFKNDGAIAKPSQISAGVAYTQKEQFLAYMPFSVFYNNIKYYINGEVGFFKYNYKYFGIGENQIPEETYGVDYPRLKILVSQQIGKNLYAGLRYQFENYKVTSTEVGKELASGKVAGSQNSRTSSLGISFLKDTRDAIFYPRKGTFAEFYILPTLKAFGADRNFNRIVLDFANYQPLHSKVVLATNIYGSFIQGKNVPFNQLSLLGGAKKMRGLFEGKFRDKNFFLLQAESRFEVWKFIGLTAFSSLGYLGDEKQLVRFDKPKFTYGAGLRIKAIKKEHINIRIDYGIQPKEKGNLYLTIGEAF
ncbi:BamA/TamA family outer membrane protein [Emticicia sp. SJ17W-69]|uniref:BamA/TamA family outer membrane protein n=1 Tax=Emticicia sp. SJ17W-69 TaxID=3421657 RepID=UPI003EC0807E